MSYKIIDLFSGAGGMTLGFTDPRFCGGFESILAVDNDKASLDTHYFNFGGKIVCRNIEEWIKDNPFVPDADVVIGGPPCQGFSLLNKKRKEDTRRTLWEHYFEIVERSSAKLFVMENVAELATSGELLQIIERADRLGFSVKTHNFLENSR